MGSCQNLSPSHHTYSRGGWILYLLEHVQPDSGMSSLDKRDVCFESLLTRRLLSICPAIRTADLLQCMVQRSLDSDYCISRRQGYAGIADLMLQHCM